MSLYQPGQQVKLKSNSLGHLIIVNVLLSKNVPSLSWLAEVERVESLSRQMCSMMTWSKKKGPVPVTSKDKKTQLRIAPSLSEHHWRNLKLTENKSIPILVTTATS